MAGGDNQCQSLTKYRDYSLLHSIRSLSLIRVFHFQIIPNLCFKFFFGIDPICKASSVTVFSEVEQQGKPIIIFSSHGIYPNKKCPLASMKREVKQWTQTQETGKHFKIPLHYLTTTTSFSNLFFLYLMPKKLLQMSH